MKKTIKEWEKEFGVTILDPNGFDRTDLDLHKKLFTKDEFHKGMIRSTISIKDTLKFWGKK